MKNHILLKKFILQVVLPASSLALLAGCATSGVSTDSQKVDPKQAERSRVYFEGVTWSPAADVSGVCAIPADLDKAPVVKKNSDGAIVSKSATAWRDLLPRANACMKKRDWKSLETLGTALARLDLDSPWGPYYLSVSADEMGDRARAEWMIDLANHKSDGQVGLFVYQRARIASHATYANHNAKAVSEMQKAVALSPELTEGHLFLGEVFQRDMQYDDAARSFQAALNHEATSFRALTGLAEVEFARDHREVAAELYERALRTDRTQVQVWTRLAYIYENTPKAKPDLALNTYKGLRSAVQSGAVKAHLDFDLDGKIKLLEAAVVKANAPVQASAVPVTREPARSKK